MDSVEPVAVRWMWPGRIPFGRQTMLDGDPGTGKSSVAIDLAARLTTGRAMPDGSLPDVTPAGVVVVAGEDGIADTLRPRIDAADGDPSRIAVVRWLVDEEGERHTWTVRDTVQLTDVAQSVEARLLIIDPLSAYMGNIDSHRDADVRGALLDLFDWAERSDIAVLAIRHLRKGGGTNAVQAGGGAIAFSGAARSVLLLAEDPDDPEKRILAHAKSNLSPRAPSLKFKLEQDGLASRVVYYGESPRTADELVDRPSAEERSAIDEATDFLNDALFGGIAVPAAELKKRSGAACISWRTVRRARERIGVKVAKQGFSDGWAWSLPSTNGTGHLGPSEAQVPAEVCHQTEEAPRGHLGTEGDQEKGHGGTFEESQSGHGLRGDQNPQGGQNSFLGGPA